MSEQRKISFRKVFRFAVGTLLVVIFMITLAVASRRQSRQPVKGLEIHLNDDFGFLQHKDIETLLVKNTGIDLKKTAVEDLDLALMQKAANTHPWVAAADVFVDSRQILQVNLTQRQPVARIFDIQGRSYYMDSTFHTMPVSKGYAYSVPVFTNVPVPGNESMAGALKEKIGYLSTVISADSLWQAQITQVEVQPDLTFVLLPLLGDQKILLGDTTDVKQKLNNLKAFYKNVFPRIGWGTYEKLDLRFKGQVVASPTIDRIPPKPVDSTAGTAAKLPAAVNPARPAAAAVPKTNRQEPAVARAVPKSKPPARQEQKKATPKGTAGTAPKAETGKNDNKTAPKGQTPKYIYPGKAGKQ